VISEEENEDCATTQTEKMEKREKEDGRRKEKKERTIGYRTINQNKYEKASTHIKK
jgi:hypothetical protein